MTIDQESLRDTLMRRMFVAQLIIIGTMAVLFGIAMVWDLGSFWFAFGAGILGASIALIKRFDRLDQKELERAARSWFGILMPLMYGGVMAAVAYGLFMSQILSGEQGGGLLTTNLFPNFTGSDGQVATAQAFRNMRPQSLQSLGKLLVWCFVAGYSERFIVGVLSRLDQMGAPSDPAKPKANS